VVALLKPRKKKKRGKRQRHPMVAQEKEKRDAPIMVLFEEKKKKKSYPGARVPLLLFPTQHKGRIWAPPTLEKKKKRASGLLCSEGRRKGDPKKKAHRVEGKKEEGKGGHP